MIKDILVPQTGTPADADALAMGIDLASRFDAHLAVLELVNLPMLSAGPWGLMPEVGLVDLYKTLRDQGERNVVKLRARMEKESISSEVRLVESLYEEPFHMAAHCAHYADLSVVASAADEGSEGNTTRSYLGSLLVESGRPVMVVPQGCKATMLPRRIVVAWKPTREAARAVHDAMPFLCRAENVDIVVVNPVSGERGHGDQPGADIATHLTRHGVKVNVVVLKSDRDQVSTALLRHAGEMDAQLLVAGGYGHSRFREWALGGVTRELAMDSVVPLLFSH
jgi:nucleotide-binding universal stress UspA family protein